MPPTHICTRLAAFYLGLPGWTGTRKVKLIWILLKQETMSGSCISWVWDSLQADNHASTPPLCFLQTGCPSCCPINSVKALIKKVKVAHTRLPSIGFRSWSRFLAVSLQVTWVINPAVGCHYFLPGLQLPSQPLRGLLPVSLLGEQRHDGCEQFA